MAVQHVVPEPDGALSKTISVPDGVASNNTPATGVAPGLSKQIINSIKWAPTEKGIIPTAGISVGRTQYVNFMSIRNWDNDGRWTTNFSAIAVSPDNGEHWGSTPGPSARRHRTASRGSHTCREIKTFSRGRSFGLGPATLPLFVRDTVRTRRSGVCGASSPRLCAGPHQIRYWSSARIGGSKQSVGGHAGFPGPGGRTVGPIQHLPQAIPGALRQRCQRRRGKDSAGSARTVGSGAIAREVNEIPGGIYAPFLHPWSTGKELYFNLSLWSAYNVMSMKSVLP